MSNVEEIVAEVKRATDYQINKKMLRERILTELHMPYNNGLFKITPELLSFAATWPMDVFYLEDVYQNPIHITSPKEFTELCNEHYQRVMNTWHQQHSELKRLRKI